MKMARVFHGSSIAIEPPSWIILPRKSVERTKRLTEWGMVAAGKKNQEHFRGCFKYDAAFMTTPACGYKRDKGTEKGNSGASAIRVVQGALAWK